MTPLILSIGEILWDALPRGLFLGGAPFNVACHLRALGEEVAFASRVGDDALGREARRRLPHYGLSDELVPVDAERPTGFVEVELDATGAPAYTIVEPAAWDAIRPTRALQAAAADARALVFGSLAQRASTSRRTIQTLWKTDATKVFDVNLRPPFVERQFIEASLEAADVVKMNDDELAQMTAWFGLPSSPEEAMPALAERFNNAVVCVTRGADGAILWNEGHWTEHLGHRVEVIDTVGAGDAFLAAFLAGLLAGADDDAVLERACRLGAYVATQIGAAPRSAGVDARPMSAASPSADRANDHASADPNVSG